MLTFAAFQVSMDSTCLPYCVSPHALPVMCVYMSTCMNANTQACEQTLGLSITDPYAGVNMCVHASRHAQFTAVMTPTFAVGFLSDGGFSSSSYFLSLFFSFSRSDRKCLPDWKD